MEIKPTLPYFLQEDQEWEQVNPLLRRQIHGFDSKIMLVVADFKDGGIGSLHKHHHSQVTYVASGEFEMTIGDDIRIIKGGDSYYIPTNVMHGCKCIKAGTLIDVFSPAREDFFGVNGLLDLVGGRMTIDGGRPFTIVFQKP